MREAETAETVPSTEPRQRLVLVTGLSGAGRTTCLKALEDAGFEAVDNLPISLFGALFSEPAAAEEGPRSVAVGVDIRTRDFAAEPLLAEIGRLRDRSDTEVTLLFLDCDDEVLGRRFTETRRRHPLASDRPVTDGIRHERRLLFPLRAAADHVIDTTESTVGAFRQRLWGLLGLADRRGMTVTVTSFAYRHGLPREADLVFDVRFLDNPNYVPALKPLDGRDERVARHVEGDADFARFFAGLTALLGPLLPRYASEGKTYLTIAIGCTGGRHRSVFVAERLGAWLAERGQRAAIVHRDIDRSGVP